jgi:hypothetical protein
MDHPRSMRATFYIPRGGNYDNGLAAEMHKLGSQPWLASRFDQLVHNRPVTAPGGLSRILLLSTSLCTFVFPAPLEMKLDTLPPEPEQALHSGKRNPRLSSLHVATNLYATQASLSPMSWRLENVRHRLSKNQYKNQLKTRPRMPKIAILR